LYVGYLWAMIVELEHYYLDYELDIGLLNLCMNSLLLHWHA